MVNDLNHGKVKEANYSDASKLKKTIHRVDVEEDPTLDEYHNMKGKKEDDDSTQKPTTESTRVDHFANLSKHTWKWNSRQNFQNLTRSEGRRAYNENQYFMISMWIMYLVLFQINIWWFWYYDGQFSILMLNKQFD